MWCPGQDPGTEKGHYAKAEESKYDFQFVIIYEQWCIDCDECAILMEDAHNRENWNSLYYFHKFPANLKLL